MTQPIDSRQDEAYSGGVNMGVKPIGPDEVVAKKAAELPDKVVEVWNVLIARAWDGRSAVISQDDAILALGGRGLHDEWLNIEELYRKAGWTVEYDKPGYNEEGRAFFTFSKKKP